MMKSKKAISNILLPGTRNANTGSETFTTKDKQEPNNPYEIHVYENETKNLPWESQK